MPLGAIVFGATAAAFGPTVAFGAGGGLVLSAAAVLAPVLARAAPK
jgi:hypothetical protein